MNAKAKGSRNERRSRRLLEAEGYVVTRAGGWLGPWDLVGVHGDGVALVQVKSNRWPAADELAALRAATVPACCGRKLVHRWNDRARVPVVMAL